MRAAIYCRISRDRRQVSVDGVQRFTMLGVERQEEDCRELCRTLGWEVVEVYVDNDVSATSSKPRPAYLAMLQAIRDERVDAIICWHPDRLYRRTVDLDELVKVCDKHRVPVATVNAGAVDLTTPTGRLVAGLLAQVAKYEGEHKAERWRRSWRQRRESGAPPTNGYRMFGWTREGEVVDQEAEAVRWATRELIGGAGVLHVCRGFAERGLTSTVGKPWTPSGVRAYFTNPRIAGWVTLDGVAVAKSLWPALISAEDFETLQSTFKTRANTGGRRPRVSSLIGVMRCGACDAVLITGQRKPPPGRGRVRRTYKCPPPRNGGNSCVEVDALCVEAMVEGYAQKRLADPRIRREMSKHLHGDEGPKLAYEITKLEARHAELTNALSGVEEGTAPVSELNLALERVNTRLVAAREALAAASPVVLPSHDAPWPSDVSRRHALVSLVVSTAWVDPIGDRRGGGTGGRFHPERVRIEPRIGG